MKFIAYRFLLSAASIVTASVLVTTSVSAMDGQNRLAAHVPFSFKAGKITLEAGDYYIAPNSLAIISTLVLHNADTQKDVLMLVQNAIYQSKDNRPRIVFRCAARECVISQVFTGADGWQFVAPKRSLAEKDSQAVVYFSSNPAAASE